MLKPGKKVKNMPFIPQSLQRQWRLQRWNSAWRPLGKWTKESTFCFSEKWEILEENLINIFGTRPAGRTAGQGPTSPRFTRVVFDLTLRHCLQLVDSGRYFRLEIVERAKKCSNNMPTHIFVHIYFGRHDMTGTGAPRSKVQVDVGETFKRNRSGCVWGRG